MSKKTKSARTRAGILESAWDLVSAKRDAVSMVEIARAAGLTRQAVYTHFPSRGALLVALVRHADDRFLIWEGFEAALKQPTARDRLDACLDVWLEFVPRISPVATVLIRTRVADEDAATAWSDRMNALKDFLEKVVLTLADEKALKSGWSVREAAEFLWSVSSVQNWDLLVTECGWSEDRAAAAIKASVRATLLVDPSR